MAIKGITSKYNENFTRYHVLSENDCELFIENALKILAEIGMEIEEEKSLVLLKEAGCIVEGSRVKVPREIVVKAIDSAPSHIDIYNRKGEFAMDLGGTNVYFGSGPTNPNVNDFETKERRPALVADTERSSRIMDACPNMDFVMNLTDSTDCPAEINDVYTMRAMLMNTTKPLMVLARDVASLDEQMQMATAVVGGWEAFREKPFVMCLCGDPITPLAMENDAAAKLIYCAENHIPFNCPSGVQLGSTGPVTLPAAVALGLAENLFCLVLAQAAAPGCPYMGGVVILTTDMKTTAPCYGTPEHCLGESMAADLYHYLDLPLLGTAGMTESKVIDEQLAIEGTFAVLSAVLDGGHATHDVGFMDSALTTDLDAIVMIDEIVGYARRIAQGVTLNEEEFGFDAIAEVGPKGEFLTNMHTLMNFGHVWYPAIIDRNNYNKWVEKGAKDFRTRLHERTAALLAEHVPEPLPAEVIAQIDEILASANARIDA